MMKKKTKKIIRIVKTLYNTLLKEVLKNKISRLLKNKIRIILTPLKNNT